MDFVLERVTPDFPRSSLQKRLRVLVIEDDNVLALLLAEMLDLIGYEVCGIYGAEIDAVCGYFNQKPDFLLVDDRLRSGTGVGAMRQILIHCSAPHVFASGDPTNIFAHFPNATVIRKPYREAELGRAIRFVLGEQTI